MTAQTKDAFRHDGRTYALVRQSGGRLFDPGAHGLRPRAPGSMCWRGYHATYAVADGRLTLNSLGVRLGERDPDAPRRFVGRPGPPIAGVAPQFAPHAPGMNNVYRALRLPLDYTGGLLLGADRAPGMDFRVVVTFPDGLAYDRLLELTFVAGTLRAAADRSAAATATRDRLRAEDDAAGGDGRFWEVRGRLPDEWERFEDAALAHRYVDRRGMTIAETIAALESCGLSIPEPLREDAASQQAAEQGATEEEGRSSPDAERPPGRGRP